MKMKTFAIFLLIGVIALFGCKNKKSTYDNLFNFHNPLMVLKCRRSVSPDKRAVLDKQVLPKKITSLLENLMKTGRKARLTYVCCEYYLQNHDGETIGILTDNEKKVVQGFDVGRHADAIKLHTEAIHDVLLLNKERTKREAFSLLVGLFQKNNNNPRDDVPNTE